eukprot:maker-scaffold_5-snap-gene-4.6-mRNA-1 protein AED:0.02 eAED:0.02 QI:244/1/1/1/0.75/0.6/5/116/582
MANFLLNLIKNNTTSSLSAEECLRLAVVTSADGEVLSNLWYVGVIISVLASVASNLGVNIQKYSLGKEMERARRRFVKERGYVRQPLWVFGLVFVISGAIGDFAALGFAAQSLATPVGGFTIVANIYFGYLFHGETLSKRDLAATLLILVGLVLVAVSGDKTEKEYTLDCLIELYKRVIFIVYVVLLVFICGFGFYISTKLANLREKAFEMVTDPSKADLLEQKEAKIDYKKYQRIHPVFPTALSGIIGSQSVLFAKCTIEIFKSAFITSNESQEALGGSSRNPFTRFETYLIIFCMLLTIFNQLHWLSHSLRFFDAVLVVPIFQCFFITGGVIGGAVFFDEFRGFSTGRIMLFVCGMIITIFGVILLSLRQKPTENDLRTSLQRRSSHSFDDDLAKLNRSSLPQLAFSDFFSSIREEASIANTTMRDSMRRHSAGAADKVEKARGIFRTLRSSNFHQRAHSNPDINKDNDLESNESDFRLSKNSWDVDANFMNSGSMYHSESGLGRSRTRPDPIVNETENISSSSKDETEDEKFRLSARSSIGFNGQDPFGLKGHGSPISSGNPKFNSPRKKFPGKSKPEF